MPGTHTVNTAPESRHFVLRHLSWRTGTRLKSGAQYQALFSFGNAAAEREFIHVPELASKYGLVRYFERLAGLEKEGRKRYLRRAGQQRENYHHKASEAWKGWLAWFRCQQTQTSSHEALVLGVYSLISLFSSEMVPVSNTGYRPDYRFQCGVFQVRQVSFLQLSLLVCTSVVQMQVW